MYGQSPIIICSLFVRLARSIYFGAKGAELLLRIRVATVFTKSGATVHTYVNLVDYFPAYLTNGH